MRTAFIAWQIAKESNISNSDLESLFIASLLHDVGALSPEEKINIHQFEMIDPEPHCILGEAFLNKISLFKQSSQFVRFHHTPWVQLDQSISNPIVYCSQILQLADTVERAIARPKYILHQDKQIVDRISSLNTQICPEIIEIFKKVAVREDFWLDLTSSRLYSILLHHGPGKGIEIDLSKLLSISELFRNLIDFRSQFTATHSTGVATSASGIARKFGLTDTEVELMKVAGNFHDLGKLVISNSILEKPGKLTEEEFALIKQHTYFTYSILNTIGGIPNIAEWAAFHHERLDGSGYPFHLDASKLSTGTRIMAVADILTALAEDRPYRKGLGKEEILKILQGLGEKRHLDITIVDVLKENFDEIISHTKEKQAMALHIFREEFSSKEKETIHK
ncbi:MAG: HD domain-containing protein [Anaerolineaceae bacterium]|nr:HD domain-containing protein [Anaerolineaceae bacterium]